VKDMRKPLVIANWKMFKTQDEAGEFVRAFVERIKGLDGVDTVICPPFTCLAEVGRALREAGARVALGAQDCFWKDEDAYTAQISPRMLVDPAIGCKYAIIGHSEKRGRLGPRKQVPAPELLASLADNDETVNAKTKAALEHRLTAVVCIGETADDRQAGKTRQVVDNQARKGLRGITADQMKSVVIAYEPVWAIGASEPCKPDEAVEVIRHIRGAVSDLFAIDTAENTRILYGGTVKPDNIAGFMEFAQIDGALVGGASLDPEGFAAIVAASREMSSRSRK